MTSLRDQILTPPAPFVDRHIGPRSGDLDEMLKVVGFRSLDDLAAATVPSTIRLDRPLALPDPVSEPDALHRLGQIARQNQRFRSYIGLGYYACTTPAVILRNVLENPGWYTQYTPYQAEIAQGRLEALLNYQTMVADLTGLPLANASLLDEATAAAEAMTMAHAITRGKRRGFFVAASCHPQTIAVVRARAEPLGIEVRVGDPSSADPARHDLFGVLLQYPATDGNIELLTDRISALHTAGALVVVATDLLALTLLTPPGEMGADIAVGSTQRLGVPLGFGGPHAAFMAAREEYKRQMPGRIVGVSRDAHGRPAYRLALQTREQHIRRDRATSNICTAQVLLAIIASFFAVYHGREGLEAIARRIRLLTATLRAGLRSAGFHVADGPCFDTLRIPVGSTARERILAAAEAQQINLREDDPDALGVSLDETVTVRDVQTLLEVFAPPGSAPSAAAIAAEVLDEYPPELVRRSDFLTHPVFANHRSEHEMLRYIQRLQGRDLSLTTSMIPLGSCTMKLNGTSEMLPITWPEFGDLHPFAPATQTTGYRELFNQLEQWLAEITGMAAVSFQPNSGAQGEYAGLLVIRAHHHARGEPHRDVCLIPTSAHGTNPASAVMAGMRVVAIACDTEGNIDLGDLHAKIAKHRSELAAVMITYPSTHGVFEDTVREVCDEVHRAGGQVYLDGANMNAQVGLCRPGDFGADVCHLNLHKTFCIPHGGGGPGMGPIAVQSHLAPFLPGHPFEPRGEQGIGPVAAAPFGSPSILPISWMYIAMMGAAGLKRATQVAILSANYMAKRLESHYPILFRGRHGTVAHEFVLDARALKKEAGIEVDDIAKRLMDFGFHAPTMSWPVPGTLMIEPTESESRAELDRFCEAMIAIRAEISAIAAGEFDAQRNPLKNAPHTAADLTSDAWDHPYSRDRGAFPAPGLKEHKYWPPVSRIDNAAGDRHLVCTCPSVAELDAAD